MYFELKENKPHGTKDDPFSTYHIKNEGRSFQIPVHWHDELEIIYVKSGFLTVSISGENYIGTPGNAFVVSPGNLHFMGSHSSFAVSFTLGLIIRCPFFNGSSNLSSNMSFIQKDMYFNGKRKVK